MSRMLIALAVAALIAVGVSFAPGWGWVVVSVTPMREPTLVNTPTFAQVQARLEGRPDNQPAPDLAAVPWARVEKNAEPLRAHVRSDAVRVLENIRRPSCERRDSKHLDYYFEQRGMQERGYAANWGPAGAKFITQAWSTPDDLQIINAMRDAYAGGWLAAEAMSPPYREHMFRLIGSVKPGRSLCK